jgi:septum formation protein
MLEAAGVPFDCIEAEVEEDAAKAEFKDRDARSLALELARVKARAAPADGNALVLGSDQTLEREDGSILSKPGSREEAFNQLRSLSGTTHKLHSAAVMAEAGEIAWSATETVELKMRRLSATFLNAYLDDEFETIRWSVGCYHVEGRGAQLFERIEGSHFAVLGLPLLPLLAYLRERGVLAT